MAFGFLKQCAIHLVCFLCSYFRRCLEVRTMCERERLFLLIAFTLY